MKAYQVEFRIEVPVDAPPEDVAAFLRFELGAVAQLKAENAFAFTDIHSDRVCSPRPKVIRVPDPTRRSSMSSSAERSTPSVFLNVEPSALPV